MIADLTADFPWGVLLMSDADSTEQIPEWTSLDEMVASAEFALVVRVRHADEGSVSVRALEARAGAIGEPVFDGVLQVPSGTLRISDAVGDAAVDVGVSVSPVRLRLFADERSEATSIDVVIG
ncbi:hypothetical protein [Kribbella shirazensis]|uniref:Uncharacterized protein n=1 Tax=Kribbella shirazensis TaxID=1105143 RepID=A0A7X5VIQ6_9ACTN|nr:hypothetical protein [Kribbella shirazensis]NIK62005.1 hypothetical protein [Kribbella shirazensis]